MECKNIEWVKWAIDCIKEEDDDAAEVQILFVRMFVKCLIFRGIQGVSRQNRRKKMLVLSF